MDRQTFINDLRATLASNPHNVAVQMNLARIEKMNEAEFAADRKATEAHLNSAPVQGAIDAMLDDFFGKGKKGKRR